MREKKGQPDRMLFYITLLLLTIGIIMVLSSSSYQAMLENKDAYYYFKRQFAFAGLGLVAMFIMMYIRPELVERLAFPTVVIVAIMLLLVPFIGVEVNGAKRWLGTRNVRFAPAEVAKPVTIICFAIWLRTLGKNLQTLKGFGVSMVFLVIMPLLIFHQDLGTAIVVAGTLFCMMIVAQARWRHLVSLGLIGVAGIVAAIAIEPYRIERITGFLHPFEHITDSGWQLVQSLYALGSGWIFGVGLGDSRQKLLYLPERHTDFIFAIIGEELGFVGATLVILLFALFVWRGFWIAMRIEDELKSYIAFGLTCCIGIQALVNLGVVVGVLPVTGITLPFISYGGSSLSIMLASVGYLLNMSRFVKK